MPYSTYKKVTRCYVEQLTKIPINKNKQNTLFQEAYAELYYLPISLSKPFPSQTGPFIILLCLTPENFTSQGRASGWERVNLKYPSYRTISSNHPSSISKERRL